MWAVQYWLQLTSITVFVIAGQEGTNNKDWVAVQKYLKHVSVEAPVLVLNVEKIRHGQDTLLGKECLAGNLLMGEAIGIEPPA